MPLYYTDYLKKTNTIAKMCGFGYCKYRSQSEDAMRRSTAKREQKLIRDVEKAGAIFDGRKIPDYLRGSEIINKNGASPKTNVEYEGHFLLSRGDHTTKFVDMKLAMEIPSIEENVGAILRRRLEENGIITRRDIGFDLIVGPARGAWPIGKALLKALRYPPGIKDVYARRGVNGNFHLIYPYPDRRDIRTLIVDDVFTTGSSIQKTMLACDESAEEKNRALRKRTKGVKEKPASFYYVAGVVGINRAPDWNKFLLNTITLWIGHALRLETDIWTPDNCELCREGVPLYKV